MLRCVSRSCIAQDTDPNLFSLSEFNCPRNSFPSRKWRKVSAEAPSLKAEMRLCTALSRWFGVVVLIAAIPALAEPERQVTPLANGVYEIQHEPNGNTTVIIGDRQVLVVDSCFLPSAAREDISQIRKWTDKPVSFVVNTHFHNDHNLGNRIYMDA